MISPSILGGFNVSPNRPTRCGLFKALVFKTVLKKLFRTFDICSIPFFENIGTKDDVF